MAAPSTSKQQLRCKCVVLGDGCIGKTCLLHNYANNGEFLAAKQTYIPTIFENYEADIPIGTGTETVKLSLWDTAGQEEFDELRRMCYGERAVATAGPDARGGGAASSAPASKGPKSGGAAAGLAGFDVQVFIVCFALDKLESFTSVEMKWYREIRRVATELAATSTKQQQSGKSSGAVAVVNRPFSVLLVGTRCDLLEPTGNVPRDGRKGISEAQARDLQRRMGADAYIECSAKTGAGVRDVFDTALMNWWERREQEARDTAASAGAKSSGNQKNDGKSSKDGGCQML